MKSSGHETVAFRCAAAVVVQAARKRMRTRYRKNDISISGTGRDTGGGVVSSTQTTNNKEKNVHVPVLQCL